MKTLKFKDGVKADFVETSTLNSLVTVASSFSELDDIKKEFEKENNLIGGTFDGSPIARVVYTGVSTSAEADGNITATFTTRGFTHDEIVDARLNDLEQAVAEM